MCCVHSNSLLKTNPQCDGGGVLGCNYVWMRSGRQGPHAGIGVLIRKGREARDGSLSNMGGHNENMALCEPGRDLSAGTEPTSIRILDFTASRSGRNKCLFFKPPSLGYGATAAQVNYGTGDDILC